MKLEEKMIRTQQRLQMSPAQIKSYIDFMADTYPEFKITFDSVDLKILNEDKTLIIADIILAEAELYRQYNPADVVATSERAYVFAKTEK